MGNCINRSPSSVIITRGDAKPPSAIVADELHSMSCDERTADSSSNATLSPPTSPLKPVVEAAGTKQDDGPASSQQDAPQPKQLEMNNIDEKGASVEEQREDGQRRLRELVISGANAGEIDWKTIISLAEDLHKKEQHLLRSYNEQRLGKKLSSTPNNGGCNSEHISCSRQNISKRQAFFEKRRRKREISRRRKLESVGSFSVNLHMYEAEEEERCYQHQQEEDSPPSNIAENYIIQSSSSGEKAMDDTEEFDVFEDDDPSPLHHDPLSCSTPPSCRERRGTDSSRPGTPMPFVTIGTASIAPAAAPEGSFMAATSLFASANDEEDDSDSECSSSESNSDSSTSSVSQRENWDLMTIDEDATVTDW